MGIFSSGVCTEISRKDIAPEGGGLSKEGCEILVSYLYSQYKRMGGIKSGGSSCVFATISKDLLTEGK